MGCLHSGWSSAGTVGGAGPAAPLVLRMLSRELSIGLALREGGEVQKHVGITLPCMGGVPVGDLNPPGELGRRLPEDATCCAKPGRRAPQKGESLLCMGSTDHSVGRVDGAQGSPVQGLP